MKQFTVWVHRVPERKEGEMGCTKVMHARTHACTHMVVYVFLRIISARRGGYSLNPSTLGGGGGWITRSRDRDHPGQHGETPSLPKIQKN